MYLFCFSAQNGGEPVPIYLNPKIFHMIDECAFAFYDGCNLAAG